MQDHSDSYDSCQHPTSSLLTRYHNKQINQGIIHQTQNLTESSSGKLKKTVEWSLPIPNMFCKKSIN